MISGVRNYQRIFELSLVNRKIFSFIVASIFCWETNPFFWSKPFYSTASASFTQTELDIFCYIWHGLHRITDSFYKIIFSCHIFTRRTDIQSKNRKVISLTFINNYITCAYCNSECIFSWTWITSTIRTNNWINSRKENQK